MWLALTEHLHLFLKFEIEKGENAYEDLKQIQRDKNKVHKYLFRIGTVTGYHQDLNKRCFVKGYQVPLCTRCCGIWEGYILGLINVKFINIPIILCIIILIIMFYASICHRHLLWSSDYTVALQIFYVFYRGKLIKHDYLYRNRK